ncbi:uncharacterized protein K02A2.6-like [Rhipicephalus sanguineus]|uniref:uncharacterized protein K02A2.6-like n=1 Tax=Rhipicephalus sanguineus TaxID=34632 RepID=UPI0018942F1C|nr:uncharacterized protein K02A2.6-like [Rhipicephalus sanguineus]
MATGGMYGAIEPFSGKSWASWIQRVNFYFVANDISNEEKKRAFLLTLCGADTFETACALVAPKTPGEVSFSELVALLQRHFDPRPSELYGRYVFQRRDQNPGESISSYVAALKNLTVDCYFGVLAATPATSTSSGGSQEPVSQRNPTMLPQDVMLRDRFVCGIRDEHLQQRLFAEKELSFQRALDIALSAESASRQQRGIKAATNSGEINKVTPNKQENKKTPSRRRCYRCDGWHDPSTCKFKTAECRFCAKVGHIGDACIARKKQEKEVRANIRQQTHSVNPLPYDETVSSDSTYELHAVNGRTHCPKFLVDVEVERKSLQFEVDTGAARSLISEETYHKARPRNAPQLSSEPLDLRTWSGELRVLGTAHVRVKFKSDDCVLPLLVMKGARCNLLGRDWFAPLHIQVHGINHLEHPTDEIREVISRHPDVFREDINGYRGPLIHLELEEDASPKFCKARPVPLALQGPMEDELDRLQHQGILSPIQHSNWATPLVLVRKNDGTLRVW